MATRYVNPLAAALVLTPADPPDLVFYHGFIGPVEDETVTRIFLNPVMNRYVDIPTDLIVYSEKGIAVPTSPWAEDVVWVARIDAGNLREEVTSLAVAALGNARVDTTGSTIPAGTVVTVNVGAGSGEPSTGGGGGIGGGGDSNFNVQWPPG